MQEIHSLTELSHQQITTPFAKNLEQKYTVYLTLNATTNYTELLCFFFVITLFYSILSTALHDFRSWYLQLRSQYYGCSVQFKLKFESPCLSVRDLEKGFFLLTKLNNSDMYLS